MTFFEYNTTLPNPPDDPADDVAAMQTNTMSVAGWTEVDHVGFNNTLGGFHNIVTFAKSFPFPASIPLFVPGIANLCAGQTVNSDNQNWPVWRNNAPNGPYQIMGQNSAPLSTTGYITTSFGLIIQWGKVNKPNSLTGNVTFPLTFPNAVFGIFFTLARNSNSSDSIWINTSGTNNNVGFAWKASTSLGNNGDFFFWMAIGN